MPRTMLETIVDGLNTDITETKAFKQYYKNKTKQTWYPPIPAWYSGDQVDSVGCDAVLVGHLVFATVCLLFWSEQAGRRGTTVWLVSAEMVLRAAGGIFLAACLQREIEKTAQNGDNLYKSFFIIIPLVKPGFCAAFTQSHDGIWAEMQLTAAGLASTCCILPNRSRLQCHTINKYFQQLTVGQPLDINLSSPG